MKKCHNSRTDPFTYDGNARITGTYLKNSSGVNLDAETYVYNQGNQRTQQVFTAGNYMNYGYDNIGELTNATGSEPGGVTNRMQEQFGYTYDPAGNLTYRTNTGLGQTFAVNNLNELTQVHSVGGVLVEGTTTSPATNVTVNGVSATLYVDNMFASTNQTWGANTNVYTAIARDVYGRLDTNSVTVRLALNDNMDYDLNGNLLRDKFPTGGTNRVFAYDGENQLIAVWVTNTWLSTFTYDGKMRRRVRKEYTWGGSAWLETNEMHYLYDGNLVVQERDANNLPQVTYTRGTDLSGTLQDAGGIGGLLARTANSQTINPQLSSFATALYHADGNGNVTALIYTNQTIAAKYEYDPYGNLLSKLGALAEANLYRFSSKEYHPSSGLIYYLLRSYDPSIERWLNKDPLGDFGFNIRLRGTEDWLTEDSPNLYNYVLNNPIGFADSFGLEVYDSCKEDPAHGGYKPTRSISTGKHLPLPWGGDAEEMRVVQRKCNFRCYHKDTDNCPKIPCTDKSCQRDHGVAIQVTVNATGSGAAATCKDILPDVQNGSITGGSINRNHVPILW